MNNSHSESYKAAGVDVTAGYRAVELMKEHVRRTKTPLVLDSIGGFGGLMALDLAATPNPVLVSGTDGVGTKLKLAFLADKHDTVGIDCVAMCANDVLCVGAKPLFFLDYIACGKNVPERIAQIVSGVAEGCVQSGCALVGGETAEMPGFYPEDEYDLAGFCVGVVNKDKILDKENVRPGDVILGLASSGVHSNGFSLVRKVFDIRKENLANLTAYDESLGASLLDALLTPTRIYVQNVLPLFAEVNVHSICHITGGGFYENIPRALPAGVSASIQKSSYSVPRIFRKIQATGDIPERDMYNTFNMGIGMCVIVPAKEANKALTILEKEGELAWKIGEVISGGEGVELW
ncbi:MAG: phosphoribosylformylglycinamidine cyclo-ligase [Candidatus Spyradocola sp.]|jgi:phosphoribosylformylglycinamidine cyclo-ligase